MGNLFTSALLLVFIATGCNQVELIEPQPVSITQDKKKEKTYLLTLIINNEYGYSRKLYYDKNNQLYETSISAYDTLVYYRDTQGRIKSYSNPSQLEPGGDLGWTFLEYNANGQVIKEDYDDGYRGQHIIKYIYDDMNRVESILWYDRYSDLTVTHYYYLPNKQVKAISYRLHYPGSEWIPYKGEHEQEYAENVSESILSYDGKTPISTLSEYHALRPSPADVLGNPIGTVYNKEGLPIQIGDATYQWSKVKNKNSKPDKPVKPK